MVKRLFATLMAVALLMSTVVTGAAPAYAAGTQDDASKYVALEGDWNFKLYRTYPNMYQYFPYVGVNVSWEDLDAAVLPEAEDWKTWETVALPADNPETGGLLSNEQFPSWSEAWVCREFTLPTNFTKDDTVTLLMGIVDDNDVVYINGQAVAASGFVDGNGTPITEVSPTGGFDYAAEAPEDQVKWSKSYWEIQREYTIPTDILNLGGTNEICIRVYNNNSFGGFYSGNIYALCGNDVAVRALKGLPTEKAKSSAVDAAVAAQIAALEAGDMDAYAATIAENYHNDAADKDDKVAEMEALLAGHTAVSVTDTDAAVYVDDEGNYWYSAARTIAGDGETILSENVELCYAVADGQALERGNWNRCYQTSYDSALFGQELTYSVYLPPSYYEQSDNAYPTVWLLHGRASSSNSYRDVDDIGAFMDAQIASGKVVEMVVIMPDSGKYAFYADSELTPGDKDNTGPWRTQLTTELRSEVENIYRVYPDAEFNGLSGNSMGGYGAMVVGTSNPDLYSSIGVHMGYLPQEALISLQSLSAEQLEDYDFYLDCGLQDTTVGPDGTIAVHDYLESVEKEHGYSLREGGHNSAFYMSGMPASMKMHSDHFVANGLADAETPYFDFDCPSEQLTDLDVNAWYHKAVDYVLNEKLMSGMSQTTFGPGEKLTRAMVVRILWAMEGEPVVNYAMAYQDVAAESWYTEAVRWAASVGVVSGYSEDAFGTNDPITREQLATILWNYAKFKGYDVSVGEDTNILSYNDALDISEYAIPAIQWACGEGIISGRTGGYIDPAGTANRAEAAQMLMAFGAIEAN